MITKANGLMRKAMWMLFLALLLVGSAGHGFAESTMDKPLGTPTVGDQVIGIKNPSGSWAIYRFSFGDLPVSTPQQTALNAKEDAQTPATQAEMEAGIESGVRAMSPLRIAQAIAALAGGGRLNDLQDADANATIANDFAVGFDIGSAGSLRFGDIGGGNYFEFFDGYARLVGTYYLQAGTSLDGPAADGEWSGQSRTYTVDAGESNTSFGQAYHIDSDGELIAADADVATTLPAIGLATASGTGQVVVMTDGVIYSTSWSWTPGGEVWVSTDPSTTDGLTQTRPSTAGDRVQLVGIAESANSIRVTMGGLVVVEVP